MIKLEYILKQKVPKLHCLPSYLFQVFRNIYNNVEKLARWCINFIRLHFLMVKSLIILCFLTASNINAKKITFSLKEK